MLLTSTVCLHTDHACPPQTMPTPTGHTPGTTSSIPHPHKPLPDHTYNGHTHKTTPTQATPNHTLTQLILFPDRDAVTDHSRT